MAIKPSINAIHLSLTIITALVLTVSSTHFNSYGDDYANLLDTVLCQKVQISRRMIVDIRTSMERGADLIDGKWAKDEETCISQCCGMEGCSLALFKTDGMSSSGKNCYFIDCGDKPDNCLLVDHEGFSSIAIGGRRKQHENKDTPSPSTPPATRPPPPTTPSQSTSPPTVATPPHTDINTDDTSTSDVTTVLIEPSTTVTPGSDSNTTPVSSPIPVPSSKSIGGPTFKTKPPEQKPNSNVHKPENSNDTPKNEKPVVNIEGGAPVINSPDCSKGGCEGGSGLIAIAVVGVICFIVILIVVGVLVRKVFTDRRRKRFRNVDYLINGMYT